MKNKKIGIISAGTPFNQDYNSDKAIISRRESGLPIDYFFYVRKSGHVICMRDLHEAGGSIDICWEGGINDNGEAGDTRTEQQKQSIERVVNELRQYFPTITKVLDNPIAQVDLPEPENTQENEMAADTPEQL
jgi:hypothetical protein